MNLPRSCVLGFVLAFGCCGSAEDLRSYGTFNVDVVQLVRDGDETPGTQAYVTDLNGYRYLFVSEANREVFLRAPEQYEVQLGGACGRMGELSGRGSPGRYWVYRGRLFVFASEACRQAFQQNPERYLDHDDPKPIGSQEAADHGRRLLEAAARWSGLGSLQRGAGVATVYEATYQQNGKSYPMRQMVKVRSNGDYLAQDTYDGVSYGREMRNSEALEIDPNGHVERMVPSWARALARERGRNLARILMSRQADSSKAIGRRLDGGVGEVQVHVDGVASIVLIHEATGRVVGFESIERGVGGVLERLRRNYTAYATEGGVTMPVGWNATVDGVPAPGRSREGLKLEILASMVSVEGPAPVGGAVAP